jgi:hypothetical protein
MPLSDEERQRIYEEEKARADARDEIEKEQQSAHNEIAKTKNAAVKKKAGIGCLGIIAVVAVVIGIGLIIGPAKAPIPHEVLAQFYATYDNQRIVIVDKNHPRETVVALGQYLVDHEWPRGSINVQIWDDKNAFMAYRECRDTRAATKTNERYDEVQEGPICVHGLEMHHNHRLATAVRDHNGESVDYAGP